MILIKRHSIGRRLWGLALAGGLAAAVASESVFAMLTSADVEHGNRNTELSEGVAITVNLGKPGRVILEPQPRSDPLGYDMVGGRVGRIPIDREK